MNIDKKLEKSLKQFGLHIKKLREKRCITLNELAEKTRIRKDYLQKIENGTAYGVKLENHLLKIAKVLKISLYELFNFE